MCALATRGRPAGPKARIAADLESREALAKTPPDTAPSHEWGGVRVHKFEVAKIFDDDVKGVFKRWHEARNDSLRACNIYLQTWIQCHFKSNSPAKLEKQFAAFREWGAADPKTRGKKPKWTVPMMPPGSAKALYHALDSRFPELTNDTRGTISQRLLGTLNGKDSKGRMKKWIAVLLGLENVATASRDYLIPFQQRAFSIEKDEQRGYVVTLSATRESIAGKKRGRNFHDVFALRVPGRSGSSRTILDRLVSGEYDKRNASLIWHEGKRKWFFHLAYKMPKVERAEADAEQVAVLRPHAEHPWELQLPDKTIWIGGDGRYVASMRQRVFGQRVSRQQHYRHAGSANKGHGLRRALAPVRKLERSWKDFVKTVNHTTTRRAVDICLEHNCGKLIYEQPEGELREAMFLGRAGRDGLRTQSFWDWHQVGTMLEYKGQDAGVHVVVTRGVCR